MDQIDLLEQGRAFYARRAWTDAYKSLVQAAEAEPLGGEDLELLATSAWMIGRDDDVVSALERAQGAYVRAGQSLRAVRCMFWLFVNLALRGEVGAATGWLGRAERLLEREKADCVERGYLLLPVAMEHLEETGDYEAADAAAVAAVECGQRFGDVDLLTFAVHMQGHSRIQLGRPDEGLRLLDEAMVAVTAGELSPVFTGLIYCSVISGCQEIYEYRRAQQWTAALTRWCEEQPDMVAFTGQCLIHRAEIMQMHGSWRDALEEARRACQRFGQGMNQVAAAQAFYRQGEVHRLQGDLVAAEEAYKDASRCGWEPQPGLALLRLAQGNPSAAAGAIRRVVAEATHPYLRVALLPAHVEIMLAVGDREEALRAAQELEELAEHYQSFALRGVARQTRALIHLADGDPRAALGALRKASEVWQELQAPYEMARVRILVALACRSLGDEDTAALELEAARHVFEQLGAAPDVNRVDSIAQPARPEAHGLSSRELAVLRLVAAGKSNRDIASDLFISEHTVARHLQNIFTKLGVSSRTAASAFAYEHHLV